MIYLHKSITINDALQMADIIGANLRSDLRGNLVITPVSAERHGNGHVVRMPHHKHQIKHASLQSSPEAA